jgi:hypothetical protein
MSDVTLPSTHRSGLRVVAVTGQAATLGRPLAAAHVWGSWWLMGFICLHLGYALMGRGFAYLPYPPLFVGELMLAAGLPLVFFNRRWRCVLGSPVVLLLLAFWLWCLPRTLAYLGTYKADALRDSAVYYYAIFALIVFSLLADQPGRLVQIVRGFDRLAWPVVLLMPLLYGVQMVLGDRIPNWPGIGTEILGIKAGDPLVLTGAVAAFTITGLSRPRGAFWLLAMGFAVILHGAINRGGLIAFMLAFGFSLIFFPKARWPWRAMGAGLLVFTLLLIVNPSVQIPGRERALSPQQFAVNIVSTFGSVEQGDLDDTKTWRIDWWKTIADYTLHGDYFWTGKGFGVNLANSDGFQVWEDNSLRSPHNGSMTVLARSGVPGAFLWACVHGAFGVTLALVYLRCRANHARSWMRFFIWVAAAYLAAMFHASFDVYLEGPMGGIWLWSVVGVGLGGVYLAPRYPTLLDGLNRPATTQTPAQRWEKGS